MDHHGPLKLLLFLGCAGIGLAACSQSHDTQQSAVLTELQALKTSGKLPALDTTASITGTDVNKNGVRDDLDTIIAAQTDLPVQRAALTQMAQAIQATLTLDTTNATAVSAVATQVSRAVACVFAQYTTGNAGGRVTWIQELSINTMPRLLAYQQFNNAMNDSVTGVETGAVCNG
jgi:hypothetical protein